MSNEIRQHNAARCGDCNYFRNAAHPAMGGQPCSQLGVAPTKIAPPCWVPDTGALRSLGRPSIAAIAAVLTQMTPRQARIFAGMLKGAGSLDRVKLSFFERVYFTLGRGDALDCFYSGYVLSRGPDDSVILLASPVFPQANTLTCAQIARSSILRRSDFEKARARLVEAGRLYHVPRKPRHVIDDATAYEPPTYDTSPEHLEAQAKRAERRGKRGDKRDKPAVEATKPRVAARRPGTLFHIDHSDSQAAGDGL